MVENYKNSIVEWYIDHLFVLDGERFHNNMNFEMYIIQKQQLKIKAQEMEKQQRMSDFSMGITNAIQMEATKDAEQWYNEIQGGNNEQQ